MPRAQHPEPSFQELPASSSTGLLTHAVGGGALSRRLRWVAGLSPRSLLKAQSLCWPLSAEPAQVGSAALAVPGLDSRGRWVHAVPSLGTGPGFSTGAGGERGL